ncbi:hypothetical protein BRADI_1g64649v3 [Brachypodium distachyon]|uniref:Uncharacterized protein n=1 Tax=Brachypodium distachyon TaxID=15368 RepID=A0A2K2DTE0_BRADI|nr:hypothetical protein BRADI_1g64649v3 [Brachypodium distachyon]
MDHPSGLQLLKYRYLEIALEFQLSYGGVWKIIEKENMKLTFVELCVLFLTCKIHIVFRRNGLSQIIVNGSNWGNGHLWSASNITDQFFGL